MEAGGFLYSCDSYADDLPYWIKGPAGPHLIIPYSLDVNDMRFVNAQGSAAAISSLPISRTASTCCMRKAKHSPKMMSVGLHCRIVGRPGRAMGLERFLDHIAKFDRVWTPTRLDIAHHWYREHLPRGG
jgi:peptidoglycan/xylan/chitin deacetylase (PgdA/CDA1 family)